MREKILVFLEGILPFLNPPQQSIQFDHVYRRLHEGTLDYTRTVPPGCIIRPKDGFEGRTFYHTVSRLEVVGLALLNSHEGTHLHLLLITCAFAD